MHKCKNLITILLPGIVFLAFWQWMTDSHDQRLFFFSAPSVIATTFISEIQTAAIWQDVLYTGGAALGGLILGTVFGSALGIGLWVSPGFARISRPYIAILSAIPVFAVAPMMILWFGIGLWSKIMMAAIGVFLIACAQAYEGAEDTAVHHLTFAQSLGAKPLAIVRYIILPGSWRWVRAGMRLNVGFALLGTFIAEFISSQAGLGHYILKAGGLYDMPRVFVGLILLAGLSSAATYIVSRRR